MGRCMKLNQESPGRTPFKNDEVRVKLPAEKTAGYVMGCLRSKQFCNRMAWSSSELKQSGKQELRCSPSNRYRV